MHDDTVVGWADDEPGMAGGAVVDPDGDGVSDPGERALTGVEIAFSHDPAIDPGPASLFCP